MRNTHGLGRSILGLLLLAAASAGCDGRASDPGRAGGSDKGAESVCPRCRTTVGGETGDFGGSRLPCGYLEREVDEAEAEALGFPVAAVASGARHSIHEAMTWTPLEATGGGPARGYEPHTRVFLALAIDSYVYDELDVDGCDRMFPEPENNAACRDTTAEPDSACQQQMLMVRARGELRTDDGAVTADLPLQLVKIMFPDVQDEGFAARANLRDVRGSLELDPAIPEPRVGRLNLSLSGDLERGVLDVEILPDWDSLAMMDGGSSTLRLPEQALYQPIRGIWGTPPLSGTATIGTPDDDAGTAR